MLKKIILPAFVIVLTVLLTYLFIFQKPEDKLVSPLEYSRVALNLWMPEAKASNGFSDIDLAITAKAAYFVDMDSGQVLFEKNIKEKMPVASLTKIMTAIVTLENRNWDDSILISERAAGMEPDSMLLKAGEALTVEELLYGVFLVSANDAAEALAEKVFSEREDFLKEMNLKASQLGMKDTYFINPTGLQEEGKNQYSTAYDILLMSRYAVKNFPNLLNITSTPHILLPQTITHQEYDLNSGINLLTTYPGVRGFKTGYTPEAGLTLVTIAQNGDRKVLGVILNSSSRREDAKILLDYSFKKMDVNIPSPAY